MLSVKGSAIKRSFCMFLDVVQEIDELAKKRPQFDNGVIVVITMLSLQTKQSCIPRRRKV